MMAASAGLARSEGSLVEALLEQLPPWMELPWVHALLTLGGAVLAAKLVDLLICGVIQRMTRKTKTDLDDRIVQLMHRPIFISVILCGVWYASSLLHEYATLDLIVKRGLQTGSVLIWLTTGMKVFGVVFSQESAAEGRRRWLEARTIPLFHNVARLALLAGSTFFLLKIWKLDVGPWMASAGIAGIAIGFAAKDTLANLFGGLAVIIDAPYQIGDFVNLDGGERGMVTSIGLRSTRLLTRDDVEVIIPNAQIANGKIVNETGGRWPKLRVRVFVGVAYGSDIDRVREVLIKAANSVDLVLDDPEAGVRFEEMGDSSLKFRVQCWIAKPVQRGRTIDALNTAVYKALAAEGIEIPFPQRVVHIAGNDKGALEGKGREQ